MSNDSRYVATNVRGHHIEAARETELDGRSLWDGVKRRWPAFDDWVGGATGFQVGWAVNCVRWLAAESPVPNPAILTVSEK